MIFDIYHLAAAYDVTPKMSFQMIYRGRKTSYDLAATLSVNLRQAKVVLKENAPNITQCEHGILRQFKAVLTKFDEGDRAGDPFRWDVDLSKDFVQYYQRSKSSNKVKIRTQQVDLEIQKQKLMQVQVVFYEGETFGEPVIFIHGDNLAPRRLTQAEDAAYVAAAVGLKQCQPSLWQDFLVHKDHVSSSIAPEELGLEIVEALQTAEPSASLDALPTTGTGASQAPAVSQSHILGIVAPVSNLIVAKMLEIMKRVRIEGLPDSVETENVAQPDRKSLDTNENAGEQTRHLNVIRDKLLLSHLGNGPQKIPSRLPVRNYAEKILSTIDTNQVTNIIGATGSGKITQIPQLIFDKSILSGNRYRIICTQPRRLAAKSVAQRVAQERRWLDSDCIGYQIRFENKRPTAPNSIIYCTTGMLLNEMQSDPDKVFDDYTHLVIDECHER